MWGVWGVVISGYRYKEEPIYQGEQPVLLAYRYNTGIVISYGLWLKQNSTGERLILVTQRRIEQLEVIVLPDLSMANVRELLKAVLPLKQLSPQEATRLVVHSQHLFIGK